MAVTAKTRDAGWQVGARQTFPLGIADGWDLLTSQPWLQRWSGLAALAPGDPVVRSLTDERVARVRTRDSLVQLRVLPAVSDTTVSFHAEHLPDERARSRRKDHWRQMLDDLGAAMR